MTAKDKNAETMLKIFKAVEQRDDESMRELCPPDVEFCWSGSLPYGGRFRGVTPPLAQPGAKPGFLGSPQKQSGDSIHAG